jgi:hypothetical protein
VVRGVEEEEDEDEELGRGYIGGIGGKVVRNCEKIAFY